MYYKHETAQPINSLSNQCHWHCQQLQPITHIESTACKAISSRNCYSVQERALVYNQKPKMQTMYDGWSRTE